MKPHMCSRSIAVSSVALLCIPSQVIAQEFSIGGRIGLATSNAIFEDQHSNDRIDPRLGPLFGGVVAYRLTGAISVQAELLYMQKGWTEFGTGGERKLTYLEVPILLGVGAPWTTSPHLLTGPSISYELGCSITGVPEVGSVGCDDSQVQWHRPKLQFGVWLGLGVGRWFGNNRLDLQLLGDLNVTDMNREELPLGYLRLGSVMVSVAYTTSIGG